MLVNTVAEADSFLSVIGGPRHKRLYALPVIVSAVNVNEALTRQRHSLPRVVIRLSTHLALAQKRVDE